MAHHLHAKKAIRQSERRRRRNQADKSRMKTSIKAFISAETPEKKLEALKTAHSMIDRAARKNVIHENNAARKKSQLAHAYAKFVKPGS